ncbi:MAG: tail fiber domain-containing protein, partial [Saprospiraceae bacterium]|nr:tail fiber domain-containing protein [Saprospiraceae bacterium]
GVNDPAEDTNSDGSYDTLDCQGADGIDGTDGAQGPPGPQGPPGIDGINGMDGTDGVDGIDGTNGNDGIHCWDTNGNGVNDPVEDTNNDGSYNTLDCQGAGGIDGADGAQGPPGPQGPPGIDGINGINGNDGVDGIDGTNGNDGIHCWDTNGNGVNDPAEDTNNDGSYDTLDCQGDADGNGIFNGSGTVPGNTTVSITDILNFNGDLAVSGQIFGLSDERLKIDMQSIINAQSLLSKLNPMTYRFDNEKYIKLNLSESIQYGLLAQEVEKIIPSIVTSTNYKDGGRYKSLNYNALISILIGAVNEQASQIDQHEKEIEKLKEGLILFIKTNQN